MLTKNQSKLIKSLSEKKNRIETGLFLVEGEKSVAELLASNFEIDFLLITAEFFKKYSDLIKNRSAKYEISEEKQIEKVGTLETNDSALAIARQKNNTFAKIEKDEIILALDKIQDPGNLGTIIRIADWYGIKNIVASKNTVDFYNPKVIAASKGSFTRINVFYDDLKNFLSKINAPIWGAYLDGTDIHKISFPKSGILVMGNESNGISTELKKFITKKITIPRNGAAESLNVAIATAVILDNWRK